MRDHDSIKKYLRVIILYGFVGANIPQSKLRIPSTTHMFNEPNVIAPYQSIIKRRLDSISRSTLNKSNPVYRSVFIVLLQMKHSHSEKYIGILVATLNDKNISTESQNFLGSANLQILTGIIYWRCHSQLLSKTGKIHIIFMWFRSALEIVW